MLTSDLRPPTSDRWSALDPLQHPQWDSLLADHSHGCFFHGAPWARVLAETYGHKPFYLCHPDGAQSGLLPILEVASPITGRRGVSLPFSDFCPLLGTDEVQSQLLDAALELGRKRNWRYFESRADNVNWKGAIPSIEFVSHSIALGKHSGELWNSFDEATRRGIRKAEKAGLGFEFSCDSQAMQNFYSLHCRTRRRHGLPPQSYRFFENIFRFVLREGQGFVATVTLGRMPIAAAIFFHAGSQALYKFGASDYAFQHLRPNNLLMFRSIEHCTRNGFAQLHLGRTSLANEGLRRFKSGFGARESRLVYYRYDFSKASFVTQVDRAETWVNAVFRLLPERLLRLTGRLLYPHLS